MAQGSMDVFLFYSEATVAKPPQPEHVQSGQSRCDSPKPSDSAIKTILGFQIEGCIASPRTNFETRRACGSVLT